MNSAGFVPHNGVCSHTAGHWVPSHCQTVLKRFNPKNCCRRRLSDLEQDAIYGIFVLIYQRPPPAVSTPWYPSTDIRVDLFELKVCCFKWYFKGSKTFGFIFFFNISNVSRVATGTVSSTNSKQSPLSPHQAFRVRQLSTTMFRCLLFVSWFCFMSSFDVLFALYFYCSSLYMFYIAFATGGQQFDIVYDEAMDEHVKCQVRHCSSCVYVRQRAPFPIPSPRVTSCFF